MEQWRPFPGFECQYEVSDKGRVRRIGPGLGARVGRILSQHPGSWGYLHVGVWKNNKGFSRAVHRAVTEAFLGPKPKGLQVNHRDGNKPNNSLENLEYVTPKENVHHAWRTGLCVPFYGENHPAAKLKQLEVDEIRVRLAAGETYRSIAARFSVTRPLIGMIARRKIWNHPSLL